jgi:polyisoprenoid-binding protein YceI
MKKSAFLLISFHLFLVFSLQIKAQNGDAKKIFADKKSTTITYSMTHPMHEWDGVSKNVDAVILYNPQTNLITSVAATAKVETFDSGNANRDSHMMEVMEALKYPKVTFVSTEIHSAGNDLSIVGNLTFHNVTKSITFLAKTSTQNSVMNVTGNFNVSMKDYKIEAPSLMGIPAEDLIKIKFSADFNIK